MQSLIEKLEKGITGKTISIRTEANGFHWVAVDEVIALIKQHSENGVDENNIRAVFSNMEKWIERFETWAPLCAQLLDGWHADGTAWSEWDENIRKQLTELQYALSALSPYLKQPQPVSAGLIGILKKIREAIENRKIAFLGDLELGELVADMADDIDIGLAAMQGETQDKGE